MWKFPIYEVNKPVNWSALEAQFDWFRDMKDVPQDAIWHAEGDVFTHTKMVVEAMLSLPEFQELDEQEKHILFASAMLHDVEKRSTTTTEIIDGKQRTVSPKHAKKGEYTARKILYKDIITHFHIREQITKLVRLHGLPLWAIEKHDPTKEVISASLVVDTKLLSILAKADVLGRICTDQKEILLRIDLFIELCKENKCFGKPRKFESNYSRYWYLNRSNTSPDYVPFDDLKFDVFVMSALPGSGKDTFVNQNLKGLPVLSLDEIRREYNIDPTDKKKNGEVIQIGKERAKEYMRARKSFVFNATNLTTDRRSKWISLFAEYGGRIKVVYIEVPYKQLLAQNHNRKYKVPEKVIEKMINGLEIPTPQEAHELQFEVK
ncbi:AAA family ATPase [Chondrinema litorale]|uniref:AAA family ATPase n=1 Tax=Chondrinema litorale TaxID=2994555 RepID=UPI0025430443|nr:AAA family ATPase [Chondrinema litorale]UZR96755.1 AAA family ATPase [Chondrinema litorale]